MEWKHPTFHVRRWRKQSPHRINVVALDATGVPIPDSPLGSQVDG